MASLIAIVIFPTAIGWCQVEDRPQFLLLKNGQLLAGHVSLHGDRYLVAVPYGEIQVRRADVDQIVGSPQEAYLHRKNATRFGDADEHLRLAQWCLDRSLVAEAETQLEAAVGLQPHHPRVPLIKRQLRLTTTPRSTAKSISATEQPARSADQLDGLVRGMPQGVVETFTKTIQPVLVNSCSARACHGSAAENGFRLWRYPRGQQVPQRVTLRNLDAVLRWVDQREPGSSRLLRAAAESHGSGRSSSALRGAPYQHLATWVEQIAGVSTDAPADTSAASSLTTELNVAPLTPPSSPHATRFGATFFRQDRKSLHNPAQPGVTPLDAGERRTVRAKVGSNDGGGRDAAASFRPIDPFDAELFNRRYHGPAEPQSIRPASDQDLPRNAEPNDP